MEMEMLNNGAAATGQNTGGMGSKKADQIKVRVFINMDEDDDGKKGIKPNDIFKRENLNIPFYVDVSSSPPSFLNLKG